MACLNVINQGKTKEELTQIFKEYQMKIPKGLKIYAVTFTISSKFYKSVVNSSPNVIHKIYVNRYLKDNGLTAVVVIEKHRSGYPHSHGLLVSPENITMEQLKEMYPEANKHAIKIKVINDIEGWAEYCSKTLDSDKSKQFKKEVRKEAKEQWNYEKDTSIMKFFNQI